MAKACGTSPPTGFLKMRRRPKGGLRPDDPSPKSVVFFFFVVSEFRSEYEILPSRSSIHLAFVSDRHRLTSEDGEEFVFFYMGDAAQAAAVPCPCFPNRS